MPPTLYLIDGHALAYRMYFALTAGSNTQRWQTSKGEPTAGIYGFARELMRILEQEKPEYIAVALIPAKLSATNSSPNTKPHAQKCRKTYARKSNAFVNWWTPSTFRGSRWKAMKPTMCLARWRVSLRDKAWASRSSPVTATSCNWSIKRTAVYLAGDDQNYITDEDVVRKLGVRPDQVVDYKAIVGDKSDNIPGVAGVGEKTAVALLEKFGTLDAIYKNIDQVENRWKTKLEADKDTAYLSRDLAQIHTDLEIKLNLDDAKAHEFNSAKVEEFFKELEFRTLIKTLERLTGKETSSASPPNHPADSFRCLKQKRKLFQ